jgi:hypothetical protein
MFPTYSIDDSSLFRSCVTACFFWSAASVRSCSSTMSMIVAVLALTLDDDAVLAPGWEGLARVDEGHGLPTGPRRTI